MKIVLVEFFGFLRERKRFILIPFFTLIILLGLLVVFGQAGTVLLPIVYTLF